MLGMRFKCDNLLEFIVRDTPKFGDGITIVCPAVDKDLGCAKMQWRKIRHIGVDDLVENVPEPETHLSLELGASACVKECLRLLNLAAVFRIVFRSLPKSMW